jgi:hypothetical protein
LQVKAGVRQALTMPRFTPSRGVGIGAIHIIESLRPKDRETGRSLDQSLKGQLATLNSPISVHFWREPTKQALFERLALIAEHFEMHGDHEGLQLTSGELIDWQELKPELTRINVTSRLNLLVVVQACYGQWILQVVQPTERAPIWGLIGPRRELFAYEVDAGNLAFYSALLKTQDGGAAWEAMNASIPAGDAPFTCLVVEEMFCAVFSEYLKEHFTDRSPHDHRAFFEDLKSHFFLVDLCEDHSERFPMSFEECGRVQSAAV